VWIDARADCLLASGLPLVCGYMHVPLRKEGRSSDAHRQGIQDRAKVCRARPTDGQNLIHAVTHHAQCSVWSKDCARLDDAPRGQGRLDWHGQEEGAETSGVDQGPAPSNAPHSSFPPYLLLAPAWKLHSPKLTRTNKDNPLPLPPPQPAYYKVPTHHTNNIRPFHVSCLQPSVIPLHTVHQRLLDTLETRTAVRSELTCSTPHTPSLIFSLSCFESLSFTR
jgi:hypothetical protein